MAISWGNWECKRLALVLVREDVAVAGGLQLEVEGGHQRDEECHLCVERLRRRIGRRLARRLARRQIALRGLVVGVKVLGDLTRARQLGKRVVGTHTLDTVGVARVEEAMMGSWKDQRLQRVEKDARGIVDDGSEIICVGEILAFEGTLSGEGLGNAVDRAGAESAPRGRVRVHLLRHGPPTARGRRLRPRGRAVRRADEAARDAPQRHLTSRGEAGDVGDGDSAVCLKGVVHALREQRVPCRARCDVGRRLHADVAQRAQGTTKNHVRITTIGGRFFDRLFLCCTPVTKLKMKTPKTAGSLIFTQLMLPLLLMVLLLLSLLLKWQSCQPQ